MSELPLKPFKRILKNTHAERASADAVEELRDEIEEVAQKRATDSANLMEHAGRKTVQAEDVKKSL